MENIDSNKRKVVTYYFFCIAIYCLSKWTWQFSANIFLHKGWVESEFQFFWVAIFTPYLLMVLNGALVGFLIERKIIAHASLATSIGVFLDIYFIINMRLDDYYGMFFMLTNGVVLGGVGGAISLALKKLTPIAKQ